MHVYRLEGCRQGQLLVRETKAHALGSFSWSISSCFPAASSHMGKLLSEI